MEINRFKVVDAMTHAFFDGYTTALIEGLATPGESSYDPKDLRRLMVDEVEKVINRYSEVMAPLLIALNYTDYPAAVNEIEAQHFSPSTMATDLLRFGCRRTKLFYALQRGYRRCLGTMVNGQREPISEHFEHWCHADDNDLVAAPAAIRAVVRAGMHAYGLAIRSLITMNGKDVKVRQSTVIRLMGDAMAALLHDEPYLVWDQLDERGGLEACYRTACKTDELFNKAMDEMTECYHDMAVDDYWGC